MTGVPITETVAGVAVNPKKKPTTFRELERALREKLNSDDRKPLREVSRDTKIPLSRLADFKNGQSRGLTFERMDALARYFDVEYSIEKY